MCMRRYMNTDQKNVEFYISAREKVTIAACGRYIWLQAIYLTEVS